MKSLALILTIVLSIFNVSQPNNLETEKQKSVESNNEITTYYLIRHAEKDRSDATEKDPLLTNQGTARAKNWAKVFKDVPFQMVYSTNYKRTKATAQPTATSKELERNRLHLAMTLKEEGNVLLLDEPTNDLDVNTLRALEEGLDNFAGCAVVISHDRWFLDRICTHILAFEGDSQVYFFEGGFSDYEENKKKRLGGDLMPKRIKYKKLTR
jgi:ATPase subunit of ABC transporter with duplicated ATPase domains